MNDTWAELLFFPISILATGIAVALMFWASSKWGR